MGKQILLLKNNFYHIYNCGYDKNSIFPQERNYEYFLTLWNKYISRVAETFAYCLMDNHFHSVIRMNSEFESDKYWQPFSNFFNAYAKSVNKAIGRKGYFFQKSFKRKLIQSNEYLLTVIRYVHQNPQKHKFTENFQTYPYSSYHSPSDNLIQLFGSEEEYKRFHSK